MSWNCVVLDFVRWVSNFFLIFFFRKKCPQCWIFSFWVECDVSWIDNLGAGSWSCWGYGTIYARSRSRIRDQDEQNLPERKHGGKCRAMIGQLFKLSQWILYPRPSSDTMSNWENRNEKRQMEKLTLEADLQEWYKKKKKNYSTVDFPCHYWPQYYLGSYQLNFGDQTGSSAFR